MGKARMSGYAALLRGVNSGRNPTVKMEVLRKVFQDLGFENVKSILASGNILFEAASADEKALEQRIEAVLPEAIGFQSAAVVRTTADIRRLVESNPFKDVTITPQTRPYVTFVKEGPKTDLELPVTGKGYTILGIVAGVVCSVVDLSTAKTPDLMQVLDRKLGPNVTTRSWNTVEKISLASE